MISVFYVLGTPPKPSPEVEFPEMELGKFFTRSDAERHAEVCRFYKKVRIEERREREEDQHYAHGGLVGLPVPESKPERGRPAWKK